MCLSHTCGLAKMFVDDAYIDYDSDYSAKAEAGRIPAVNVDPYAGMHAFHSSISRH